MHLAITIFWVLAVLLLAQSVAALFLTFKSLRYFRRSRSQPFNNFTPPVALIIPCKGLDPEFEFHVSCYLRQDYPHYQLVFVVASVDDPAYQALRAHLETAQEHVLKKEQETIGPQAIRPTSGVQMEAQLGGVQTVLVVAGYSDSRGEKVHNLLAGLKKVDSKAEVLVVADIDVRPKGDWLRSLVSPLADPTVTVSTGSQWHLPGRGFTSRLRAAWGALSVRLLGEHDHHEAWGGSMAIRTADFKRLAVAERYWANAVNDDDTLSLAVHEAGGRIRFEPRCMVASVGELKLGEFLRYGTRQMVFTRVYSPGLWFVEAATYVYSCGTALMGMVLLALPSIAASQRMAMAGILLAIALLVVGKGFVHETIMKELFPEEAPRLSLYGACYWKLSLLAPWVVLLNYLLSGLTRRIEWRGTHYELRSRNETRFIRREKQILNSK
jgi:hypothetical protein